MLYYLDGDIFESPAKVLVNAVNTVGVMGKGIAKDFKAIYPEMFAQYQNFCETGRLTIGKLWLYKTPNKWVLNFPTKEDWRNPSRPEYIEKGLRKFVDVYAAQGISSIAFPRIGCGHGELDWSKTVEPLIRKYLHGLPIDIFVYSRPSPVLPEHRNIEAMKRWLRSEPQSLSFRQVWDDLAELSASRHRWRTENSEEFRVEVTSDDFRILPASSASTGWRALVEALRAIATRLGPRVLGSREIAVPKEALLDFWQAFRVSGFVEARTMPDGLDAIVSYLYPVLSGLPYIRPATLAAGSEVSSPIPALRLYPLAFQQKTAVVVDEEALKRA